MNGVFKSQVSGFGSGLELSKLNIINTALDYCRDLEEAERKISAVKQRELDRRRHLMMKLSSLSNVCQSEMTRHDET